MMENPDTTGEFSSPPPDEQMGSDVRRAVLVTGASGFVGRYVVRELVSQGFEPVCFARDPERLRLAVGPEGSKYCRVTGGDLLEPRDIQRAAEHCAAAVHLVGIISEAPHEGQTFERMHVDATRSVVTGCASAGVNRYVHMSALGARADAPSRYHRTKHDAETVVRASGLDWTIMRPSVIHGPDGEFMRMMRFLATGGLCRPVMPYFGRGTNLVQPVSVYDVATCFVKAITLPATIGQTYDLGGPDRLSWRDFYDACAEAFHGRRRLKMPVPVVAAKLLARTVVPLVPSSLMPYKFNVDQVLMSQEDSVCDSNVVEETFGIRLRHLRDELTRYANNAG